MTKSIKSSIVGGTIFALMTLITLTLVSGCMGSQTANTGYNQDGSVITGKATDQGLAESITLAPAAPSTTQPATCAINPQADYSQVSISIVGCDEDNYNNSMVAGYVTNSGATTLDSVPIVTQLQTTTGEVVSSGEKTILINTLKPGENRKFSVVYENSTQWKRCRASINGNWQTP